MSGEPETTPNARLRDELAASRMAILRAADIAAELAKLTGDQGMQYESGRFVHQAAKIKRTLVEIFADGA